METKSRIVQRQETRRNNKDKRTNLIQDWYAYFAVGTIGSGRLSWAESVVKLKRLFNIELDGGWADFNETSIAHPRPLIKWIRCDIAKSTQSWRKSERENILNWYQWAQLCWKLSPVQIYRGVTPVSSHCNFDFRSRKRYRGQTSNTANCDP